MGTFTILRKTRPDPDALKKAYELKQAEDARFAAQQDREHDLRVEEEKGNLDRLEEVGHPGPGVLRREITPDKSMLR